MGNCPIFFRLSSVFMPVLWTIENCMTRDSFFSTSFLTNAWNDCVFFYFYIFDTVFWPETAVTVGMCLNVWHENTSRTEWWTQSSTNVLVMMSPILYGKNVIPLLFQCSMMHIFGWWVWNRMKQIDLRLSNFHFKINFIYER